MDRAACPAIDRGSAGHAGSRCEADRSNSLKRCEDMLILKRNPDADQSAALPGPFGAMLPYLLSHGNAFFMASAAKYLKDCRALTGCCLSMY